MWLISVPMLHNSEVSLSLLDAANDRDPLVQEQVRKSILTLGKQQPDKILSMCQDYLVKHPKVRQSTLSLSKHSTGQPHTSGIISLASDEMTRSKDVIPDWQQAASDILVAVGNKHINDIMEEILSKFQPGVLPHFFVVQTLASLSESNVYGMVPFLSAILGTMLPMLSISKQDNMKFVFSSALARFSESIMEYLANLDKAPDPTVRKDTFSSEIYAAYDILFSSWLQSREPKLRLTVAEALGSMSHLMPHDKLEEQLPKLIPTTVSLYKKNNEHYIISKSLCQILDASVNMGSRVLETQTDSLLLTLHQEVTALISSPPHCRTPANTFPDRLIVFVLQKLENNNERNRMGSLAVLRHLINSSTSMMETKKSLILASIRQPLLDQSNKVKKMVVQVISAMAHHGYLELEGGDLLVKFIVQHCALHDTLAPCVAGFPYIMCPYAAPTHTRTLTLILLSLPCLSDSQVLWPSLLCYLTPAQYSNATTPLCRSLVLLGNKKKSAQEPSYVINFSEKASLPSPYVLMVRLLVNAAFPFWGRGRGAPSLRLLTVLAPSIHPNTQKVWESEIPPLLSYLEGEVAFFFILLSKTLVAISDDKWSCQLSAESTQYLPTYNSSLEEKSFLYKCIGVTLQQCRSKDVVRKQLQEVLITARHSDTIERTGVAMGIGLCASSHLDDTLAKLEDFGKSDAFKKASGIFGLLKVSSSCNDVDIEKMKSTLILCYGYVALNAPGDKILARIDSDILRCISKHFNTKVGFLDLTMKLSLIQSVGLIARAIGTCVTRQSYLFSRKMELLGAMLVHNRSVPSTNILENMVTFHNLGALLGRLSPRCTDSSPLVRRAAIDCIYTLLYIQLRYDGFALDYKDESVESLITLREKLNSPDPTVLYTTCSGLTKIISKRLPQQQLITLIFMLFEGLVDPQANCSRASSVMLNTLLKNRGAGLQDLVPEMLEVLHIRLQVISEEQVKVAVAQSVLILATQHLQTVVNTLIAYPLPFDSWSCEMWIALGADSTLASQIMEIMMEKLAVMAPYADKKESMLRPGMSKFATGPPLAMTCALREIMLNGQSADAVVALFPRLFSTLLVRLGSSVGVQVPKDINSNSIGPERKQSGKFPSVAVEALRILLARAQLEEVLKPLDSEGAWEKMQDPKKHMDGVTLLARAMAKHAGPRLPTIVENLCPSLNNIYECQRITVIAFFSELLNHHVVTELMMMDMLMNSMMERISDQCSTVRMLAIRGLGNIAVGSPEKVPSKLLYAMSSGMEEKDDPGKRITLEAMSGLSKVLLYLDKKNVIMFLIVVILILQENDEIRCTSIMLLGNLSKFGSGEPVFKDQIHNVLVSLLLHLNDPSPQVVKASKYAMRVCAPVVGSEQIATMFQNHLHEDKGLHYGEFVNDLTKYIVSDGLKRLGRAHNDANLLGETLPHFFTPNRFKTSPACTSPEYLLRSQISRSLDLH
uniref:Maestro heat like repeat family member 1 n=1 Tax=Scleropages formosus TaxID=113540 RepID=A0A8C9TJ68_SCLFO